jgi:hypothetical protein
MTLSTSGTVGDPSEMGSAGTDTDLWCFEGRMTTSWAVTAMGRTCRLSSASRYLHGAHERCEVGWFTLGDILCRRVRSWASSCHQRRGQLVLINRSKS